MRHATDWRRLREIAEERRDGIARRLAEAAAAHHAAQRKLEMLEGYRRDYDARLAQSGREGIDAARLRGYRTFLANLEQAIAQQCEAVDAARQRVTLADADWRREQRQVDSFRILDERRVTSHARHVSRSEQKLSDEYATRTVSPAIRGSDD